MNPYEVVWGVFVDADSPEEAVKIAKGIQADPETAATFFTVYVLQRHYGPRLDGGILMDYEKVAAGGNGHGQ